MTDSTTEFFEGLAERGHEPMLKSMSGTLRFDIGAKGREEHWYVTVRKGDVEVTRKAGAADAAISMGKQLFAGMAEGRVNTMAAFLRGEVEPEGDLGLLMTFQRLLPGPAGSRRV